MVSNRIKNAVLVTFAQDYTIGKKVYFKKDASVYMHKMQAEKFKANGAKFKGEKVNIEKVIAAREAKNFNEEK